VWVIKGRNCGIPGEGGKIKGGGKYLKEVRKEESVLIVLLSAFKNEKARGKRGGSGIQKLNTRFQEGWEGET